jgi:hypothetical protein
MAAITLERAMGTSMTLEGATDAEAFALYIEHFLAPSLCEGQVVVARWARSAPVTEDKRAHRSKRGRAFVLGVLLGRVESRGGGLQQDQGAG